jgi:hypothetical protein
MPFLIWQLRAEMHEPMYMRDWIAILDKFTNDFGLGVLESSGSVRHDDAVEKAHSEYATYRQQQSDELTEVEKAYLATLKEMQKKLTSGGTDNAKN